MGVSTDAVIFYGYCWEDEAELFDAGDDWGEWDDIIAKRRGVSGYEASKAIKDEFAVDIDHHGSDGWRVPYIYVTGSTQRAYRGDAHVIDPAAIAAHAEVHVWDERIRRFIEELSIDTSEAKGPAWFLVSWWG